LKGGEAMLKGRKVTFQNLPYEYELLQEGLCGKCEGWLTLNLEKNYAFCPTCQIIYKWSAPTEWKKFSYKILPTQQRKPTPARKRTKTTRQK